MLGGLPMSHKAESFEQLRDSLLELISIEALEHFSCSDLSNLSIFLSHQIKNIELLRASKSDDEWAVINKILGDSQD